jgi:hypothetical protein
MGTKGRVFVFSRNCRVAVLNVGILNDWERNKKNTAVIWVAAPCSLVEVYRRFRGTCLHHRGDGWGGSRYLSNVSKLLPDYTALQPTRQQSSYSPPWEPQILQKDQELWGFQGGENEDCGAVGCEVTWSYRWFPTFRLNLSLLSSPPPKSW